MTQMSKITPGINLKGIYRAIRRKKKERESFLHRK